MLDVINASRTELPRVENDSSIMLNCWEKPSPLIKELERTVNFAERKCGDLMQQLHFYKECYEKWIHAERRNYDDNIIVKDGTHHKKKSKKNYKQLQESESSSENDFEKVNQYFYKKIKSKISEMNKEISIANRKLQAKELDDQKLEQAQESFNESGDTKNIGIVVQSQSCSVQSQEILKNYKDNNSNIIKNKHCKSEPIMNISNSDLVPQYKTNQKIQGNTKVVGNQSTNTILLGGRNIKKKNSVVKRRHLSLQKYKLRSKSLPQGVRRKFGFGGFIEVFDPQISICDTKSKSKTSVKSDVSKHSRVSRIDGHYAAKRTNSKNGFAHKAKRNYHVSTRSVQYRVSKSRIDNRTADGHRPKVENNSVSKETKSESVVGKQLIKMPQYRNAISQNNICQKPLTRQKFSCFQDKSSCKDLVSTDQIPQTDEKVVELESLTHLMAKPNTLVPFLRHPIPFIPVSSTSKTFNLGLNVQQVLSLIKHKRHSITLQSVIKNGMKAAQSVIEPTVNTLFFSHMTTSHSQVTTNGCPARACIEDTISIITDDIGCRSSCSLLKQAQAIRLESYDNKKLENLNPDLKPEKPLEMKLERPEDVWVVEQPDPASRACSRSRSKCTCYPSKHCVDYHKVLKEYTGWKKIPNKTTIFTSENYSSYRPIPITSGAKLYPIPSQENVSWNIKGNYVKNDINYLSSKYSYLEDQITHKSIDYYEATAELDVLESEVEARELELKDVVNFYQQLTALKRKLKILREKSGKYLSEDGIQTSQPQRPKKDPLRPTPSMALTKVLRKIQGLQDKIKLIDAA